MHGLSLNPSQLPLPPRRQPAALPAASLHGAQQYYTSSPDNVRQEGGALVLQAQQSDPANPWSTTSGRVSTLDKFSVCPTAEFPTVRIEARMKVPEGAWRGRQALARRAGLCGRQGRRHTPRSQSSSTAAASPARPAPPRRLRAVACAVDAAAGGRLGQLLLHRLWLAGPLGRLGRAGRHGGGKRDAGGAPWAGRHGRALRAGWLCVSLLDVEPAARPRPITDSSLNSNTPSRPPQVYGSLHFGGAYPDNQRLSGNQTLQSGSLADDWHVYAAEWELSQVGGRTG